MNVEMVHTNDKYNLSKTNHFNEFNFQQIVLFCSRSYAPTNRKYFIDMFIFVLRLRLYPHLLVIMRMQIIIIAQYTYTGSNVRLRICKVFVSYKIN